ITVPEGAEMLTAREQHGQICIWFKCDPGALKVKRRIALVGTGYPAPDDARYLGSAHLDGGHLVLHVFERATA
ncbi:DUF7352 domain-containing protein, partial [Pseudomonas fluorescens]|uniref:DUF7352 domain-containing protein n=1 Tax=Pseudomonas fluorescens TaxID=294 RepID=UPI001CA687CE